MKIFNRYFVSPILIRCKDYDGYCPNDDCLFIFRVLPVSRMGGTTRTSTYRIQWRFGKKKKYTEFSVCLRPDVTRYYWKRRE